MSTVSQPQSGQPVVVRTFSDLLASIGEVTTFALKVLSGVVRGAGRNTLVSVFYAVGYRSVPVIAVTGLFIGMVLAEQAYAQFSAVGLATRLGSIVSISVVRELGPVLAATMLAGRVGSSMAAELATMRITEQVDALSCLGVNPVHYLCAPRFLACVLLIPLLTIVANFMGVLGGALVCVNVYHIDRHFYWQNMEGAVTLWDLIGGLVKPTVFGAAIAIVSCHRGLSSEPGAEGVGRASTRAFVASFIAILVLDFFLAVLMNNLYDYFWPGTRKI
jgi:phospholipid/cholesterol/gamma-HCH transport system permease protein